LVDDIDGCVEVADWTRLLASIPEDAPMLARTRVHRRAAFVREGPWN
jgi:hypothetical protein